MGQRRLLLLGTDDEVVEAMGGERASLKALHPAPDDVERRVLVLVEAR